MAYDLWNPRKPFDRSTLRPLYPDQIALVNHIALAIREGHKRIMVQAPTGFGKTLVSAHLIGIALEQGKRPIFTCPSIDLVNKTLSDFEAEGISDIGVMQAQHERTDADAHVQIASVQTLVRRKLRHDEIGPIFVDEAHEQFAGLNALLDSPEWADKVALGLSATPWSRGLGLHWGKLIIGGTTKDLIARGRLCKFAGYGPGLDADLSKVRTTAGDFNEGDLGVAMGKHELVADIVQTWLRRGEDRQTFLFAVDRAHAAALREEFRKAGVPCGYIDGNCSPEERAETFRRFRNGDDRIIASVGCLIRGVDEDVRCIIIARPTQSIVLHCQMIGRGLRVANGKQNLLILDHAGNCERLGMPDEIHHEKLDARKPGEKEKPARGGEESKPANKPRKCKACGFLMPHGVRQCPQCGAVPSRPSAVEVSDGELIQFGSRANAAPKTAKDHVAALGKQEVWSMLSSYGEYHGYKSGWAAQKYRQVFGVWPRGLSGAKNESMAPELSSWLTAERIRYAKAMGGKRAHA